jgi:flagellar basal-body rod modification protein FlgD
VTYSGGKAYVNVNGNDYDVSKVASVLDDTYYNDGKCAEQIFKMLAKLPSVEDLSLQNDQANLETLLQNYNAMRGDRTRYLTEEHEKTIDAYANKYKELLLAAQAAGQPTDYT